MVSDLPKKARRVFTGTVLRGIEIAASYSEGTELEEIIMSSGEIVNSDEKSFYRLVKR